MFYKYIINDKYIIGVGTGPGGIAHPFEEEITEQEYNTILDKINNCPKAPKGYFYRLTTTMEWEPCKFPKMIEPTAEEETIEELPIE